MPKIAPPGNSLHVTPARPGPLERRICLVSGLAGGIVFGDGTDVLKGPTMLRNVALLLGLLGLLICCSAPGPAAAQSDAADGPDGGNGGDSATSAPADTTPKILLKIKFPPGTYQLAEETQADQRITLMGQTHRMIESMVISGRTDIADPIVGGDQRVAFLCQGVKQSVTVDTRTLSFDSASADKQDPELSRLLRPLIGWAGAVTIDSTGDAKAIEGIDALMARVDQHSIPPQMRSKLQTAMEAFLRQLLTRHWTALIPEHPVKPGDKWPCELQFRSVPLLGPFKLTADCALQELTDTPTGRMAALSFVARAQFNGRKADLPASAAAPMTVTFKTLDVQVKGTADFDMALGVSTHVKVVIDCRGEMVLPDVGGQEMTASVELTVKHNRSLRKE